MKYFNPTVVAAETVAESVDQLRDTNVLKQALNEQSALNVDQLPDTNVLKQALNEQSNVRLNDTPETKLKPNAVKDTVLSETALARKPEVLNARIKDQLEQKGLNAKKWEKLSPKERVTMAGEMFDVMLTEMKIPDQIRSKLRLSYFGSELRPADGAFANRYRSIFESDPDGVPVLVDFPRVSMHYSLRLYDYRTVLGALYSQAIHVMQQATCLEPAGSFWDPVEQAKWADEVKAEISGKTAKFPGSMFDYRIAAEKEMLKNF